MAAYIKSNTELKEYMLRQCSDIHKVEVTDAQLNDIINETLDKFIEFSEGGVSMRLLNLDVNGEQEHQMDFDVYAIIKIFNTNSASWGAVWSDKYVADTFGAGLASGGSGLLTIDLTQQHLSNLEHVIDTPISYEFNTVTRKLYLWDIEDLTQVGIQYYKRTDLTESQGYIYDNTWVKRYSAERARRQWGLNLSKYEGSMLPGNLQLNASAILSEAKEELDKLDEELIETWQLPTDWYHE